MLISRTQGTRPDRNTGRAAGFQDSERRLAFQPVGTENIRLHERAGHRRWSTNVLISSPLEPKFSPSRGSLPSRRLISHGFSFTPNFTTPTPSVSRLNPRQAPQKRRVDPDPTTGHPQVSLSGALLCGCGASKHTDQSRGTSISYQYGARRGSPNTNTAAAR